MRGVENLKTGTIRQSDKNQESQLPGWIYRMIVALELIIQSDLAALSLFLISTVQDRQTAKKQPEMATRILGSCCRCSHLLPAEP